MAEILRSLGEATACPTVPGIDLFTDKARMEEFLKHLLNYISAAKEVEASLQKRAAADHAERASLEQSLHILEGRYKRQEAELGAAVEGLKGVNVGDRERVAALEAELAEYIRIVERQAADVDSLHAQIRSQSARVHELRALTALQEEQLIDLQSKVAQADMARTMAQQESEKYKKQAEWNAAELEQSVDAFNAYRRQKSMELASSQIALDAAKEATVLAESRLHDTRRLLGERERALEDLMLRSKDLQTRLHEQESAFESEMNTKTRLADLHASNAESFSFVETVGKLQEQLGDVDGRIQQVHAQKEESLRAVYDLVAAKESELEKLRTQLSELATPLQGDAMEEELFSPSAASARRLQRSGKTFADIYAEYIQSKAELAKLKAENDRMRVCLQDICADIESRVPQLQEEKRENERLKREVMAMSQQLIEFSRALDRSIEECTGAKTRLDEVERERTALRTQVSDLNSQVQCLLQDESRQAAFVPETDSDAVISARLVTFANIQELQTRNQELLRVVRELSAAQEQHEALLARKADAELQAKLEGALQELGDLKDARQRQAAMVEAVVRQRDMLKEMLQKDTATPLEGSDSAPMKERCEQLRTRLDELQAEKDKAEQALDAQLRAAEARVQEARIAETKAASSAKFHQDRLEHVQHSLEAERREVAALKASCAKYLDTVLQQQGQIQGAMSDVLAAREKEQKAAMQLAALQAELNMLHGTEKRMQSEMAAIVEERARLSRLVTGLQAIAAEREASEADLRSRTRHQIEVAERDLQAAQRRLQEQTEAHKADLLGLERERKELLAKVERLQEANARLKDDMLSQQRRSVENLEDTGASAPSSRHAVVIQQYKDMAQQAEAALQDLSQLFDDYKAHHAEDLRATREENHVLRRRVAESESALQGVQTQLASLQAEAVRTEQAFAANAARLEARIAELLQYEELVRGQRAVFGNDLQRAQEMLLEATGKYEAEQAAHVAVQEQLRALTTRADGLQAELDAANRESRQAKAQRETVDKELEGLRRELAALQERLDDAHKQNDVLLRQCERVIQEGSSHGHAGASSDDLGEVVKYLRRQRDILQAELDAMRQDHRRTQSQLEMTAKLLDETRALLHEERTQSGPKYAAMQAEYASLLQKVDQYNAVRESNQVLRAENGHLQSKLDQLQADYDGQKAALGQLQSQGSQLGLLEGQLGLLHEDRDRWRARFNEALSGSSGSEELERLRAELAQLQSTLDTRTTAAEKQIAALTARLRDTKAKLDDAASPKHLEQQLEEHRATIATQAAQIERLNSGVAKLKQARVDLQATQAQLEAMRASHAAELDQQRQEHRLHEEAVTSQLRIRLSKLEKELHERKRPADDQEPAIKKPKEDVCIAEEPTAARDGPVAREEPALTEFALKEFTLKEPALKEFALEQPALKEFALKEPALEQPAEFASSNSEMEHELSDVFVSEEEDELDDESSEFEEKDHGDNAIEEMLDMPLFTSSGGSEVEDGEDEESQGVLRPEAAPFVPAPSIEEQPKRRIIDLSHVGSGSRRLPIMEQQQPQQRPSEQRGKRKKPKNIRRSRPQQ